MRSQQLDKLTGLHSVIFNKNSIKIRMKYDNDHLYHTVCNRWQTIIWTNDDLVYRYIYASFGRKKLKYFLQWKVRCFEMSLKNVLIGVIDKTALVQVMAWCRQAASHYLNECWHRFMMPNDITGLQWVKKLTSYHPLLNQYVYWP